MYMRVPVVPFVATVHTAKLVELGKAEEEALWHAVADQALEGNCDVAIEAMEIYTPVHTVGMCYVSCM